MQYILDVEEKAYNKFYQSKTTSIYEALYKECVKRIIILTKIIREYKPYKAELVYAEKQNEKMELINTYKDKIKQMKLTCSKLDIDKKDIEIELRDQQNYSEQLEKRIEELELFKFDDKALFKLDFETLLRYEEDCQNTLNKISNFKTLV